MDNLITGSLGNVEHLRRHERFTFIRHDISHPLEVDGPVAGIQAEADRVEAIAKTNKAREVRKANTEAERLALWKARKGAFGTVGRLGYPSYCTQDGVVPRTKLPQIMRHIRAVSERHRIAIANVFHAGDGNIHPVLLFDERDPDQVHRVLEASHEILDECIRPYLLQ